MANEKKEEILDKSFFSLLFNSRMGSGDDMFYEQQIIDYVNKQRLVWIDFITFIENELVEKHKKDKERILILLNKKQEIGEIIQRERDDLKKQLTERDKEIFKVITEYKNPYPKDVFDWNSKEEIRFDRGRFNQWCFEIVEVMREDLLKELKEGKND